MMLKPLSSFRTISKVIKIKNKEIANHILFHCDSFPETVGKIKITKYLLHKV